MPITVREMWQLEEFRVFRLVAGEKGLDNKICNVGILDYEYATEDRSLRKQWAFAKNAFVISSFLFAKNAPEKILDAIKGLVEDQISCLAVKTIYYQELPEEALKYANEHGLPIFLFGRDEAYFEEIVVTIKSKMAEWDDRELLEERIDRLLEGDLTVTERNVLVWRILKADMRHYIVVYCVPKEKGKNIYHLYRSVQAGLLKYDTVFCYRGGFLLILDMRTSEKGSNIVGTVLKRMQFRKDDFWIGIGRLHSIPEELNEAIEEGMCAQEYARRGGDSYSSFDKMGIYQILMPYYKDKWMLQYSQTLLSRIREFDQQYAGELFKTMQFYVKYGGDVGIVAEQMHLHKNTVRYRVNKVKELLSMEQDSSFAEQMLIAFKIYELSEKETEFFNT